MLKYREAIENIVMMIAEKIQAKDLFPVEIEIISKGDMSGWNIKKTDDSVLIGFIFNDYENDREIKFSINFHVWQQSGPDKITIETQSAINYILSEFDTRYYLFKANKNDLDKLKAKYMASVRPSKVVNLHQRFSIDFAKYMILINGFISSIPSAKSLVIAYGGSDKAFNKNVLKLAKTNPNLFQKISDFIENFEVIGAYVEESLEVREVDSRYLELVGA